MLGKPFDPKKHKIAGYYFSEKLDGGRCFWDGGLSRGIPTTSVPWASVINPKTGQPKTKIKPFATGLWSRYGNPIIAPDWFLNTLPSCPLDGELWAGRGNFQKTMSAIKKDEPVDEEWREIQFGVFGCPNIWSVMRTGEIKNTNFHCHIDRDNIEKWIKNRELGALRGYMFLQGDPHFSAELAMLNEWIDTCADTHFMIKQTKLPKDEEVARTIVEARKREIIEAGGEGLFLRSPDSVWQPTKVETCIKVKGELDDEGTVVGFVSGRETDKGSKLLGLIGALVLDYKGSRLELSGLTYDERRFQSFNETEWATAHPGEEMPADFQGVHFKTGDRVTFKYRELTNDGVPKEARYFRKR
jgi:DNA ligase-1